MSNIRRVSLEEQLFRKSIDSSGKKVLLDIEQKSTEWMIHLAPRVFTSKNGWWIPALRLLATAKAWLQLLENFRFVQCVRDITSVQDTLPSLEKAYSE